MMGSSMPDGADDANEALRINNEDAKVLLGYIEYNLMIFNSYSQVPSV